VRLPRHTGATHRTSYLKAIKFGVVEQIVLVVITELEDSPESPYTVLFQSLFPTVVQRCGRVQDGSLREVKDFGNIYALSRTAFDALDKEVKTQVDASL